MFVSRLRVPLACMQMAATAKESLRPDSMSNKSVIGIWFGQKNQNSDSFTYQIDQLHQFAQTLKPAVPAASTPKNALLRPYAKGSAHVGISAGRYAYVRFALARHQFALRIPIPVHSRGHRARPNPLRDEAAVQTQPCPASRYRRCNGHSGVQPADHGRVRAHRATPRLFRGRRVRVPV